MNCEDCYITEFQSCYGYIYLDLSLTPTSHYFVWIEDKHGNIYTIEVTSDADGNLQVPTEHFPEGMLIAEAGNFTAYISTDRNNNTKEAFTIAYTEYTCIVFSMFSNTEI